MKLRKHILFTLFIHGPQRSETNQIHTSELSAQIIGKETDQYDCLESTGHGWGVCGTPLPSCTCWALNLLKVLQWVFLGLSINRVQGPWPSLQSPSDLTPDLLSGHSALGILPFNHAYLLQVPKCPHSLTLCLCRFCPIQHTVSAYL